MYDPISQEPRWQQYWEEHQLFLNTIAKSDPDKESIYLLFAFAYPSGSGLHVGHVESKSALDILARFHRMSGRNVFFPVGWDAFGLPAENYAIKTGVHPQETTQQAIHTFTRQIKRIGISYDWHHEVTTCNPDYYRWTQWLFLKLYQAGLAYQKSGSVNWCPSCQTVLANEQVVTGECERCGSKVVQKQMKQWYFKITEYKEELISGLQEVDWPAATKQQQLNWIGKKTGIEITYSVQDSSSKPVAEVVCFTTRPDTNFGATFVVLAPEHELVDQVISGQIEIDSQLRQAVQEYKEQALAKTELDRQKEGRTKTGAFLGLYAQNQLTGQHMPIWVSDFVLAGFGTGAVVGVPGHDLRDFEFAKAFELPITRVVIGPDGDSSQITSPDQVQEEAGTMINSQFLDGLEIQQAIPKMMDYLEDKGWGRRVTTYKLRDWLISRQRYWGAPIPVVYDPEGKPHPVKEEHLPWSLPDDVDYNPKGKSPLASSKELFARVEKLYGKGWTPEVDTMDTFVDSSWYYLRYLSSRDQTQFMDQDLAKQWLPVDFYMIGPEHIVLHLLYSRFFTKFLRDQGYLTFGEPFAKMRHQGMILGPDGRKMSKSKGNVISPDDVIDKFGADTLRVYEMFMGPIEADKPWDTGAVQGVYRFLNRVHDLVLTQLKDQASSHPEVLKKLHQVIAKVSSDIPELKFNTAIAAMMEFLNTWEKVAKSSKSQGLSAQQLSLFIKLLAPFAPFLAEELYQQLPKEIATANSVHLTQWPSSDPELAKEDRVTIAIQVNGKLRAQLDLLLDDTKDKSFVIQQAKQLDQLSQWLEGKEVVKEIYVPAKIVNFVVK